MGLIVFVIFTCIGVLSRRNCKLVDLCSEKLSKDVIKIADLYKEGQKMVHYLKEAQKALNEKIGTEADDKLVEQKYCGCCSNVVSVPSCRYPSLLILKKSMVPVKKRPNVSVHMNKLLDYYKNGIYVAQSPTKEEFERYYDVILQEKIGVVVWLCRPNETLEAYIPMRQGNMTVGDYVVEYELSGKRDDYDFYFIRVVPSVRMPVAYLVRVIFVIAHSWTTEPTVPKHMSKHCDVVSLVQCFHDFTADNEFPGLLVHHNIGVNVTVGFVTCYIGRQMLLDKRKVNIVGLAKYIRQHRHRAFTHDLKSAETLQLIYMILGSFARTFAYENGELYPVKVERDLFDRAKNAQSPPRESVSEWGDKFSYVKKIHGDSQQSVMKGKIVDYEPPAPSNASSLSLSNAATLEKAPPTATDVATAKIVEKSVKSAKNKKVNEAYLMMRTTKKVA